MLLARLFRRKPFRREGYILYGAAVVAARQPTYYMDGAPPQPGTGDSITQPGTGDSITQPGTGYCVPDTLHGRFDLVGLHVALLIRRLRHDADPVGAELAQAVFDAMFNDMDVNLREMGVGDMSISRRVKSLWEAFHGRAQAYEAALDARDANQLAAVLRRNLWAGTPPADATAPPRLAARAMALEQALADQPLAAIRQAGPEFSPP